ncbi:fungal-specific transcription factor domain-containing protein [Aspergillus pseudonomiae]|uniref:Fungal-specific transcription factor domain-containing protein n=1 Tax=Aspergillus pseudonomiae TaxID=1506151 RepID=A0A5N7DLK3_9EURO|nr:fungal-specific transcription factor domain-containing protein [Aspergillus pseudonomiae]KAE8407322.1 fungal-specific transcription factor domain-containing protein [Aspergillus pseudonomiae]
MNRGEAITAKLRASRRRHPRASRACETCRVRKTKCDQAKPCSYCAYHALDCVYRASGQNESSTPTVKRHAQARGVQRAPTDHARPSPWPEVSSPNQLTSQHRGTLDLLAGEAARAPRTAINRNATSPRRTTPEVYDSASRDGLSGINLHTNGTEFYGNSSNLAFFGNLYARARNQAEARTSNIPENMSSNLPEGGCRLAPDQPSSMKYVSPQQALHPTVDKEPTNAKPATRAAQLSIVNLLYNPGYPSTSPPQINGRPEDDGNRRPSAVGDQRIPPRTIAGIDNENAVALAIDELSDEAQLEIEKIFIGSYFSNKHYIHPMLCKNAFMRRCEQEAFVASKRRAFCRRSSKFKGLYFAVVALGAINASPNETSLLDHYSSCSADGQKYSFAGKPSALDFADFYFGITKQALGDIFESCSLESAQTLLLLSVFCQNALRPHSCFMYSGMAVRTAIAIGLASGMSSLPPSIRKEGRRTWWCIYSHEVEMCCSSGRLDSMKQLDHYQVTVPPLKANNCGSHDPEAEEDDVAMIPVMVALAQIMSEASHLLYHSPKRHTSEMSQIAMSLDNKLEEWKSNLPSFLNVDVASLNDSEWAFKQKLVLRLRFYNTRILIHRPFLAASTCITESPNLLQHGHICLTAAKASIQMQYESFLHRIYIRTWWYNTTYALYGAMILLHLILSDFPGISEEELLKDVEKSLEIFDSMTNIVVARRCSEMIREVLDVARACVARRRAVSAVPILPPHADTNIDSSSLEANDDQSVHTRTDMAPLASQGEDGDFLFSLFNQDAQPDTRAEILANLVDPTILEDFAFGNGGNDFSYFLGL